MIRTAVRWPKDVPVTPIPTSSSLEFSSCFRRFDDPDDGRQKEKDGLRTPWHFAESFPRIDSGFRGYALGTRVKGGLACFACR
ncbi:hypothetical protein EFD55_05575 [Rhizobium pisi]|uniref:Uncharacterized protein n=1 Tax=Rhizobium pisi TaxID=574561 RepID=A0A427N5Y2_9HYPH|nr:hypothetical protein EFD55_05575 [Rhizobium pisi]